jgi:hypothetical protein
MVPGAILSGEFSHSPDAEEPHIEDMKYKNLTYHGPCTNQQFREILADSAVESIEEGFAVVMPTADKCIAPSMRPQRSLITIAVPPQSIQLAPDNFNTKNVKCHFIDRSGKEFRYLTVTDLGLSDLVERVGNEQVCDEIQRVLEDQIEVYLRVGLSRKYQVQDGRVGYWVQVNGIYSFPDFYRPARHYQSK